jgi:hypothetical protein
MKVLIHPNHGCKSRNMTPNQLINHLKNKGDSTHAIFVYLTKLASFQQGPARQNPAKNSFYAVPPPQPFPMTQANGLNDEVDDELGGWGDDLSSTALVLACPMSHLNCGNNELKGKVGGGEDGLSWDKVGTGRLYVTHQ